MGVLTVKRNRLGHSDLYISEIGLGCMSIGKDVTKGIRLIHQAIDNGINFLDTADLYDFGQNEEIVGKALKGRRQELILATKVGNRWQEGKEGWKWDPSKAYIKEAIKGSLRRLSTDYLDLFQLHGGTIEDPIDETIEAFEELKEEGIIRAYGISSIRPNVIRQYVEKSKAVSVMFPYSILDRRPEEELLQLLQNSGMSAIVRGPLSQGLLSEGTLGKDHGKDVLNYTYREIQQLVGKLQTIATKERSVSQIAIRYPLAHPAVATVIPGASQLKQLEENTASSHAILTEVEQQQIQAWSKTNQYELHRL